MLPVTKPIPAARAAGIGLVELLGSEACRANHSRDRVLDGRHDVPHPDTRMGVVDHNIRLTAQRFVDVARDDDTTGFVPDSDPYVLARTTACDSAVKNEVVGLEDGAHQPLTYATGGPDDANPHPTPSHPPRSILTIGRIQRATEP
jgi:hypothetical protein